MVDHHFTHLCFLFQRVQKDYEKRGWIIHHDQRLEFEEATDDSSLAITLRIAEPSSPHEKWEILPLNPSEVRHPSSQSCW